MSVFGVILVRIFRIRTEYGQTRSICLYSVRIRENVNHNDSEYGHFSRSAGFSGSRFFRNRYFRVQVFQGTGFSGLSPGCRSSSLKHVWVFFAKMDALLKMVKMLTLIKMKNAFLKISQILLENACAEISLLIKFQTSRMQLL